MTSFLKSATYSLKTTIRGTRVPSLALQSGWFFWHFLQMLLAMFAGMALFHFLYGLIPDSSSYAVAIGRGTTWHAILMNVFMIVPMVAWMVWRGHGWGHGIEMAGAMVAPIALISLLCQLGFDQYLPWLDEASGPAMFLGMLVAMLYRRDHYTGRAGHRKHTH